MPVNCRQENQDACIERFDRTVEEYLPDQHLLLRLRDVTETSH